MITQEESDAIKLWVKEWELAGLMCTDRELLQAGFAITEGVGISCLKGEVFVRKINGEWEMEANQFLPRAITRFASLEQALEELSEWARKYAL